MSSHTLPLWSCAPGMPSHTFPFKLIWLNPSPVRGSCSFSPCANTVFSSFSSLETVKITLSETCQRSNVSSRFKTFSDVQVLTELCYLHSVGEPDAGAVPRHGSPVSVNDIQLDGVAACLRVSGCALRGTPAASLVQGAVEATAAAMR